MIMQDFLNMSETFVILLSGKQGSGKTTTADALADQLRTTSNNNLRVMRVRFASIIYEMHDAIQKIAKGYGIPMESKDRTLLQLLGTEWGRNTKGENVWVDALKQKVRNENADVVIIDDMRFPNEFHAFDDDLGFNFLTVRLDCPSAIRQERCGSYFGGAEHPSEIQLDQYASDGFFDVYLDTSLMNTDSCVNTILATIGASSEKISNLF
jgi:chloramphenicol 3-O-phosphotransferase